MNCAISNKTLRISLPITTPTGKVRVKRPVKGYASEPIACRSVPVRSGDYLEWQISYDTDSLNEPSVLKNVVLQKEQGVRYGCELAWLIQKSRDTGILPRTEYDALKRLVGTPLDQGIEESERVARAEDTKALTIAAEHGFVRHTLHVPNYLKTQTAYQVEIKIAHKQRAVGNQAMVYVNLPVEICQSQNGSPLVGRCAEKAEQLDYLIDSRNVGVVTDTVLAFALASRAHRDDLNQIFSKL